MLVLVRCQVLVVYRGISKLWALILFIPITLSTLLILSGNNIAIGLTLVGISVIALVYHIFDIVRPPDHRRL